MMTREQFIQHRQRELIESGCGPFTETGFNHDFYFSCIVAGELVPEPIDFKKEYQAIWDAAYEDYLKEQNV